MTVYLDHAASTPLRAEVLERMLPVLAGDGANPSSPHGPGRRARALLDEAHERLAGAIGAEAREVVFTSGGSEAINLAIKGAAWAGKARGRRIITTAVEHKAVLETCKHLEKFGFEVVILPTDRYGRHDPDELTAALSEKTILVSLQMANNEVGTIGRMDESIERVRAGSQALVDIDAVQGAAYLPLDTVALDADLVSLAAHKLEGPKGIGALWLRRGRAILPQLHGGSQERYRRAGTEDVAGALGMAVALELAVAERDVTNGRLSALRDRLAAAVTATGGVELTGHPEQRLPGLLSVIVAGITGDELVIALDLDDIACSTGSACTTGSAEPSHVLTAMGFPPEEARGSLRLSLGRSTTPDDIDRAAGAIPAAIRRLRGGRVDMVAEARSRGTASTVVT